MKTKLTKESSQKHMVEAEEMVPWWEPLACFFEAEREKKKEKEKEGGGRERERIQKTYLITLVHANVIVSTMSLFFEAPNYF